MNEVIYWEDVVETIKSYFKCNDGDEATQDLIISIGAEILNVSWDTLNDMMHDNC